MPAKTVIITGGSSGIGRCTAMLFARHGWRVGLIARGAEALAATVTDIQSGGGQAAAALADVSDSAALARAAAHLVDLLGPPGVWINCAGNGVYGAFTDVPEAAFDRVVAVTFNGTVNGTRIALAHMDPAEGGTVVNVCSAIAFHGLPLMTSYTGAKAAVRGFGQALRAELAIQNSRVRVSTVFPPAVNTPYFAHALSFMPHPARPARPVYQPEVVAHGILLAATTGRAELVVSGTARAFEVLTRLSPALVSRLMRHMGFERQVDRVQAQRPLPSLFAASVGPGAIYGAFGGEARRVSVQLWLAVLRTRLGRAMKRGMVAVTRSAAPSPPKAAAATPGPTPAGSVPLDGVS